MQFVFLRNWLRKIYGNDFVPASRTFALQHGNLVFIHPQAVCPSGLLSTCKQIQNFKKLQFLNHQSNSNFICTTVSLWKRHSKQDPTCIYFNNSFRRPINCLIYNEKNTKINQLKCSTDLLKLPIIDQASNIHQPNKVVYPYPLMILKNLSSQYELQYLLK